MAELMAITKAEVAAPTGNVLSIAHAAGMQSSFPILQKNYKFSKVLFFGRITAKAQDYLIAVGIENSWMDGTKKFFWCQDGVEWGQLKMPTDEERANCAKLSANLMLTGNPAEQTAIPTEPVGEDAEEPAEPVMVEETLRLACIVETIEKECAMVPCGALCMSATGAVVANPAFPGLSPPTAATAAGYVFLNKKKPTSVLAPAAAKSLDFLVSCDDLVPKGALCPRFDEATGCVTVRNLVFPGFLAYTYPGTSMFGYCYFGTGEKNADIAFMLP